MELLNYVQSPVVLFCLPPFIHPDCMMSVSEIDFKFPKYADHDAIKRRTHLDYI